MRTNTLARHPATIVALTLALLLASAAFAQDEAPAAPPPGADETASPPDPLESARARQAGYEEAARKLKTETGGLVAALEKERAALEARVAAADPDDRAAIEPGLKAVVERIAAAKGQVRIAESRVVVHGKLLQQLEARDRLTREGPAALGIVVPTTPVEIEEALQSLAAERLSLETRVRTRDDAANEVTAREEEVATGQAAVEAASAALEALPAEDAGLPAARTAQKLALQQLQAAQLRLEVAQLTSELEGRLVEHATALVGHRESTLVQADAEALEAARERLDAARAEAEAGAEARRREEEEAARQQLQDRREQAARRAERAAELSEEATSPKWKRVWTLQRDNADWSGRLVDLEERRRDVEDSLEQAKRAWDEERAALEDYLAGAAKRRPQRKELTAHLDGVRARLAELVPEPPTSDPLKTLQDRERSAVDTAGGFRQERLRVEQDLATLEASGQPGGAAEKATRDTLVEALDLLVKLRETARDVAWTFDRLAELHQRRVAFYRAHLEEPAFEIFYLGNTREQLLQAAGILLATIVLSLLASILLRILLVFTKKTRFTIDELAVAQLRRPARLAIYLFGVYLLTRVLTLPGPVENVIGRVLSALVVFNVAYLCYNLVDVIRHAILPVVERTDSKLDDQLLPLLSMIAKLLILVVGTVEVAQEFGYDLTTVLAGVGVGGVAVALAAKDTVSNLFGSIMIFTDKPFVIGDWVRLKDAEGVVEAIGLRSTRIRTWEDTLVTIPNSAIGSATIENVSRFKARRVYVNFIVRLDTPREKITRAVEIVRELLDARDDVRPGHYVFFNKVLESGLNVMVYYFVKFTTWREYLTTRQEVTLDVIERWEQEGVEFAFPTTTIDLEVPSGDEAASAEEVAPTKPRRRKPAAKKRGRGRGRKSGPGGEDASDAPGE